MTEDRWRPMVTGDSHQGISQSEVGTPDIGNWEPEAGSWNPNGQNLEGRLPWLSPVTRNVHAD